MTAASHNRRLFGLTRSEGNEANIFPQPLLCRLEQSTTQQEVGMRPRMRNTAMKNTSYDAYYTRAPVSGLKRLRSWVQSYPGTVLPRYSPTPVQSYPGTVLPRYSPTPVQSYPGTVLPRYSPTPVQSYPGYPNTFGQRGFIGCSDKRNCSDHPNETFLAIYILL